MTTDEHLLARIAADHGTPAFVYSVDAVRDRIATLNRALENRFELAYALKANPNAALLERVRPLVPRADVSSVGELAAAGAAGWPASAIGFTGPAKSDGELRTAVDAAVGCIVLESVDEARAVDRIAGGGGRRQRTLIRVTPRRAPAGYGLRLAGRPTPFGIDEQELHHAVTAVAGMPGLELVGFHAYPGSQNLDAAAVVAAMSDLARIFRDTSAAVGLNPELLVFGAGLGVPCHEEERPLPLAELGRGLVSVADELRRHPATGQATLVLELGRYLVAEAGTYLIRVVRLKTSRGTRFAICDGGMHHHLAAAGHLGGPLARTYRITRPASDSAAPTHRYDVVGPLCTSLDVLARGAVLPELSPGDVLAIPASGAYGLTASPVHFLSHPPPKELLVEDSDVRDASSEPVGTRRGLT